MTPTGRMSSEETALLPGFQPHVYRGFDGEGRVVEEERPFGWPERGDGAILVAGVALFEVRAKIVECSRNPPRAQLLEAPLGPLGGCGREEDLEVGVREDHGAHVAAVGHKPRQASEGEL